MKENNKIVNVKRLVQAVILTAILVGSITFSATWLYAGGGVFNNPGTTYGPGDVDTAGYVVFPQGSSFYAKNGSTRVLDYSGTDADQVIINAIQADTSTFLRAGTYEIDSTIVKAVDNVILEGEGNATIIKVKANTNINAINVTGSGWTIRNLQIDGNRGSQTWQGDWCGQAGILVGNKADSLTIDDTTIQNCYVHDNEGDNIIVRNSNGRNTKILDNTVSHTQRYGIRIQLSNDVIISRNYVYLCGWDIDVNNKWHGIYGHSNGFVISDNIVIGSSSTGDGIETYGGENITITGNVVKGVGRLGIYVTSGTWNSPNAVIDGNTVVNAGSNATQWGQWRDGIRIVYGSTTCSNNMIIGSGQHGIYATDGGNFTISGNTIQFSEHNGINVMDSELTTISGNTITYNNETNAIGIVLMRSNYTTVTGNTLAHNYNGIIIDGGVTNSSYNLISSNTIYRSHVYGFVEWSGTEKYNVITATNTWECGYGIHMKLTNATSTSRVNNCYNGTRTAVAWIDRWGFG